MTGTPAAQPPGLAARLSQGLYSRFDLRTAADDLRIAVPKGTPWYAGHSLGVAVWQISSVSPPGPDLATQLSPLPASIR